ncbi:MAG: sugar transferase [Balneolales bacterium]|nr:sugar transferase [Balneolales bacterium]
MYSATVKPILDFVLSFLLILIVSPVLIAVSFLLVIANRGQVFFRQERPGLNGVVFRVIKFKTMNDRKDKNGNLLPDAERLTAVGRFVRSTSMDELPQLFSVLKGDMSLVGPRPLLVRYLNRYSPEQARRHEVKPGITGWAQVNGRNAISWEEKFKLDVWYVDNISFMLDIKILLLTVFKVFKREGISNSQAATMSEFKGTVNN